MLVEEDLAATRGLNTRLVCSKTCILFGDGSKTCVVDPGVRRLPLANLLAWDVARQVVHEIAVEESLASVDVETIDGRPIKVLDLAHNARPVCLGIFEDAPLEAHRFGDTKIEDSQNHVVIGDPVQHVDLGRIDVAQD